MKMGAIGWVAWVLVIIGGINWLLVGLFKLDLVSLILGDMLARLVFILVGLGALYLIYLKFMKMKKPE